MSRVEARVGISPSAGRSKISSTSVLFDTPRASSSDSSTAKVPATRPSTRAMIKSSFLFGLLALVGSFAGETIRASACWMPSLAMVSLYLARKPS